MLGSSLHAIPEAHQDIVADATVQYCITAPLVTILGYSPVYGSQESEAGKPHPYHWLPHFKIAGHNGPIMVTLLNLSGHVFCSDIIIFIIKQ